MLEVGLLDPHRLAPRDSGPPPMPEITGTAAVGIPEQPEVGTVVHRRGMAVLARMVGQPFGLAGDRVSGRSHQAGPDVARLPPGRGPEEAEIGSVLHRGRRLVAVFRVGPIVRGTVHYPPRLCVDAGPLVPQLPATAPIGVPDEPRRPADCE